MRALQPVGEMIQRSLLPDSAGERPLDALAVRDVDQHVDGAAKFARRIA
jgi:hypothetical protein